MALTRTPSQLALDLVKAYGRACARSNPSTVMIDYKHEALMNYITQLEERLEMYDARNYDDQQAI